MVQRLVTFGPLDVTRTRLGVVELVVLTEGSLGAERRTTSEADV
jgi:hypothetical protein